MMGKGSPERCARARSRQALSVAVLAGLVAGLLEASPGHAARSRSGRSRPPPRILEKDVNLEVALRVSDALESAGAVVKLTRDRDVAVPLRARAALARTTGADLFVAVHHNGSTDRRRGGAEVYRQVGNGQGEALARRVLARVAATGIAPRGVFSRPGSHGDYYFVLREVGATSILVEAAYVTNPAEARLLADPGFRRRLGDAIARGILDHLATAPAPSARAAQPASSPVVLAAPTGLRAENPARGRVLLLWRPGGQASAYRVWRDGNLLGEVEAPRGVVGALGGSGLTFDDLAVPAGRHLYEIQAVLEAAGSPVADSEATSLEVAVPFLVVVDPGHCGADPGAVGPRRQGPPAARSR